LAGLNDDERDEFAKEFAKIAGDESKKRISLASLATYLQEQGIQEDLSIAYTRGFDRDNDGTVDVREFQLGLAAMSPPKEETSFVPLASVDEDTIEDIYEDLALQLGLPPCATMSSQATRTIVQAAIDRGDIDPITHTEYTARSEDERWLDERAAMLFRIYDADCDGFLQFEELVTLVAHMKRTQGDEADLDEAREAAREIRTHIGTGMLDRPISLEVFKEALKTEGTLANTAKLFTLRVSPTSHK